MSRFGTGLGLVNKLISLFIVVAIVGSMVCMVSNHTLNHSNELLIMIIILEFETHAKCFELEP
jgi:hypothetical protein